MKTSIYIMVACLTVSGCVNRAFVNLENAPVSNGNINSRSVSFGDVILLNTKTNTFNYLGNLLEAEKNGRLDVIKGSRGNYTASAASGIGISLLGEFKGIKAEAKAAIASSIKFSMNQYIQKRFRYPNDVLNAKEVAEFRTSQASFASDKYRFLFISEVFSGNKIEYQFNGEKDDGGTFNIEVDGQKVEVKFKNGSSVVCEGKDNACIVKAQIWRLIRTSKGATGYKFVLDTEKNAKIVFQQGV